MASSVCYSDLIVLSNPIEKNIENLIEYGADKIELLMDGNEWNDLDDTIKRMKKSLPHFNIDYTIHPPAWDINLTSENKAIRETSYQEYTKAIEFAYELKAEHVVIHPGFCFSPAFDKKLAQKRATYYISELCHYAKPLGVKLAIENVGYNGTSIFTEAEYTNFLINIDDTAGYLIDTGHAHLNQWNIPKMIEKVNHRLFSLHLHDNLGSKDAHLPIGEGTIGWEPIYDALKTFSTPVQLILEYAPEINLNYLREGKNILLNQT